MQLSVLKANSPLLYSLIGIKITGSKGGASHDAIAQILQVHNAVSLGEVSAVNSSVYGVCGRGRQ
jgi:hypothetical protein